MPPLKNQEDIIHIFGKNLMEDQVRLMKTLIKQNGIKRHS